MKTLQDQELTYFTQGHRTGKGSSGIWTQPKAMAPHSSIVAWKVPWTEGPGGLQSMGSLGVGHDWAFDFTFTFHFHALEKEMATHSSVLAWRIPGTGERGGLPSMGSHRVRHDWSDLAAATAAAVALEIGTELGFLHSVLYNFHFSSVA